MGENKNNVPHIDQDVTMDIFKRAADVTEIDERTAEYIMLSCDKFWEYIVKGWEEYAVHAGRQHLERSDIQLHMVRTGLAKNSNEFSDLVSSNFPRDLVVEVLDIARGQNIVEKKRRRKTVTAECVSPVMKDLDTTTSSVGEASVSRKLFLNAETDIVSNLGSSDNLEPES